MSQKRQELAIAGLIHFNLLTYTTVSKEVEASMIFSKLGAYRSDTLT